MILLVFYLVSFLPLLESLSTEVSTLVSSILSGACRSCRSSRREFIRVAFVFTRFRSPGKVPPTLSPQSLDANTLRTIAGAGVITVRPQGREGMLWIWSSRLHLPVLECFCRADFFV